MLGAASAIVGAVVLFAIWFEPYRRTRIFSFIDPWHDAQGAGFQTVQAMIGLGSGGIFGVGLGQGVQKVFYLPEAHTDMIFAIIGEELGLVGVTLVIAAYAAFALGRAADRASLPRSVREGARGRDHDARLRAGGAQPRGGRRARSADRNPAAAGLLRRHEPRCRPRVGRHPP